MKRFAYGAFLTVFMCGACGVFGACGPPSTVAPSTKPNIVFILADDLGYGDVGSYGCPDISTPEIDLLATQGVRFTHFYSNGPECSPTRTAFMTGRYQQRAGGLECAIGVANVGRYDDAIRLRETRDLGLPASETSIARLLNLAGYETALYGKWHLGYERKFFPDRHGFEDSFGPLGGAVDYFYHTEPDGTPMLYENGERVRREGYLTDLITGKAVAFLRRRKDRPFFLYVPYTAPHTPYQGPADRTDTPKNPENWNQGTRQTFAAMVERMDRGVGLILRTLREEGFENNTLLIFASDNGANRVGRNLPYSGTKGGLYEGGIRVPCIARWPGVLPAGAVTDRATLTMDLTASIAGAAGVTPSRPYDGVNILEDIAKNRPHRKRALFWRARRGGRTWKAVRDGSLKYLSRKDGDEFEEYLFDLKSDPGETSDLGATRKADLERLKGLMAKWEAEVRAIR
ncbi:MAG: sulfatase-like hydrolase/transferase [Acidobacteria bacterium]|nr:sulfatase-like hydrolase/transferase [Acidobacteriota bacterium]